MVHYLSSKHSSAQDGLERSENGQASAGFIGKEDHIQAVDSSISDALGVADNPGQVVDAADPLSADTREPLGKAIESGTRNSTSLLPPVSIENSEFLNMVWAYMDPHKRGRLSLKDFEEQLSIEPPGTTDKVRFGSLFRCSSSSLLRVELQVIRSYQ